jgi:hypothetical protein
VFHEKPARLVHAQSVFYQVQNSRGLLCSARQSALGHIQYSGLPSLAKSFSLLSSLYQTLLVRAVILSWSFASSNFRTNVSPVVVLGRVSGCRPRRASRRVDGRSVLQRCRSSSRCTGRCLTCGALYQEVIYTPPLSVMMRVVVSKASLEGAPCVLVVPAPHPGTVLAPAPPRLRAARPAFPIGARLGASRCQTLGALHQEVLDATSSSPPPCPGRSTVRPARTVHSASSWSPFP